MDKEAVIQGLQRSLQRAIDITLLRGGAIEEAARDPQALAWGLGFVAVAGLMAALVFSSAAGLTWLLLGPLIAMAAFFLGCLVLHLTATHLFGGTGQYMELCQVSGFLAPLHWLRLVPVVGTLASLWSLVVAVVVTERIYRITREKAIACLVVFLVVSGLVTWAAFKLTMRPDLLGLSGQPTGALYEGVPPPAAPSPAEQEPVLPPPPVEEFTAPSPRAEEEAPPHPSPLPPGEREQGAVAPEAVPDE